MARPSARADGLTFDMKGENVKQLLSLFLLSAAFSTGCAVATEPEPLAEAEEPVGEVEQAFTEAACPTLTPNAFLSVNGHNKGAIANTNGINYGSDSRCPKAYRVNVSVAGAATASVYVFWQPPYPQTQSSCVNAKAFLRLYEKVGANYVLRSATTSLPQWTGTSCAGLFAWSDVQNIGNGHDWMAIAQGVGSDNILRPIQVYLLSY